MGLFFKTEKKSKKVQDLSIDDGSDLDFDFDDFGIDEPKNDRNPVEKVSTGIKNSIERNLTDPSNYKKLVLGALPKEYSEIDSTLTSNYEKLSTTVISATNTLKPEITKISNKLNKLIPENQRILRKIYDKTLGKFKEEEYNDNERVDIQQQQITKTLEEIFNKQNKVDIETQAVSDSKEYVKDSIENKRFIDNFSILSGIQANTASLRSYQDNITISYQKKSLELQYRSYFLQAELLGSIKEHVSYVRTENKAIIKNTALPDFAKISAYEKLKDVFSTKFAEKTHAALFKTDYIGNLITSITDKITQAVDGVSLAFSMAGGMEDMGDPLELVSERATDTVFNSSRDWTAEKIKALIDKNPALAKQLLTKGKQYHNRLIGNADAYVEDYSNDLDYKSLEEGGIKGSLMGILAELLKGGLNSGIDTKLETQKDLKGIYKPSIFTDKAHTSITEIIPGYLAKIYRELSIIRTGDINTPIELYDFKSSKFKTSTALAKQYKEKIIDSIKNSTSSKLARKMSENISAGDESKQPEINSFISDISTTRMIYDSKNIKNSDSYKSLSQEAKKLVDTYLDDVESDELKKAQFEQHISSIKNGYDDPRGKLEEAIKLGHGDIIKQLGLTNIDKDSMHNFNMQAYKDAISEKDISINEDSLAPNANNINLNSSDNVINKIFDLSDATITSLSGKIYTPIVDAIEECCDKDPIDFSKPIVTSLDTNFNKLISVVDAAVFKITDVTNKSDGSITPIEPSTTNAIYNNFGISDTVITSLSGKIYTPIVKAIEECCDKDPIDFSKPIVTSLDTNFTKFINKIDTTIFKITDVSNKPNNIDITPTQPSTTNPIYNNFDLSDTVITSLSGKIYTPIVDAIKPLYNKDPIDFSKPIVTSLDTNFTNLISKVDIIISKINNMSTRSNNSNTNSGFINFDINSYTDKVKQFFSNLSSYSIPDDIKEQYAKVLESGVKTKEEVMKEIKSKYKKTKKKLGDITLSDIGSKIGEGLSSAKDTIIDSGKWLGNKVGYYGPKAVSGLKEGAKWAGNKTADFAKMAKDPVFNAMNKIFGTMMDFSRSALSIGKDLILDKLPKGITSGFGMIKSFSNKVNNLYLSSDIYVKGETEPRLHARLLRNGYYLLKETGKPIFNFKDITGLIVDKEGNVVLSSEDLKKGLVDKEGKPISTPFEKLVTFAGDVLKSGINRVKNIATGIGDFVKRGLNIGTGPYGSGSGSFNDKILNVLVDIRKILNKCLCKVPDDQIDSSTEDNHNIDINQSPVDNTSSKSQSSSGSILGGFNNLISKVKGSNLAGKGLGLLTKGKGKLGALGSFFSKNEPENDIVSPTSDTSKTTKQPLKYSIKNDAGTSNKITDVKAKNNYKNRLARMEEENKDKHKFKDTEVKSRYDTGDGIMGTIKNMLSFAGKIFSVSGLSSLLTGVLGKIPLIGGLITKVSSMLGIGKLATATKVGTTIGSKAGGLIKTAARVVGPIGRLGASIAARTGLTALGGVIFPGIATAATATASVAGSVAVSLLGAVGAILTSPVALTLLGTAAVGFAAYKLYKVFTKNSLNDLEKIRYMQYGFNLDDKSHTKNIHLIKELEKYLQDKGMIIADGTVTLSTKLDAKEFLDTVGLSVENEDNKQAIEIFMAWFVKRFKPFFLKHSIAIYKTDPKLKLIDIKKLSRINKLVFLNDISKDLDEPYDYTTPPFEGMETLTNNKDLVKETIDKAKKEYSEKTLLEKTGDKIKGALTAVGKKISDTTSDLYKRAKENLSNFFSGVKNKASKIYDKVSKTFGDAKDSVLNFLKTNKYTKGITAGISWYVGKVSALFTGVKNAITAITPLSLLGISPIAYGAYRLFKAMQEDTLDPYEKIRYLQYGFNINNKDHLNKIHLIKQLEDYLIKKGIVVTEETISLNAGVNPTVFLTAVGIDIEKNKEDAEIFMAWFTARFKPFFLKHCAAIYKAKPGSSILTVDKLNKEEKLVYLSMISKDLDEPYDYTTAPFKTISSLVNNKDLVKVTIEKLILAIKTNTDVNNKKEIDRLKKEVDAKKASETKLAKQASNTVNNEMNKNNVQNNIPKQSINKPNITNSLLTQTVAKSDYPIANDKNISLGDGDGTNNNSSINTSGKYNLSLSKELRVANTPFKDGSKAEQYILLANKNVSIENIDPNLKNKLLGMVEEYGELTGNKVIFTDGLRTYQQQAELFAKFPNKAAPPGRSLHEFGLAVDADRKALNEMDSLGLMRKYGFTRPVGGEPWHMEPAGIQVDIAKSKEDPSFRTQAIESGLFKGGGGNGTLSNSVLGKRDKNLAMTLLTANAKEIIPSEIISDNKKLISNVATTPTVKQTPMAQKLPDSSVKPVANLTKNINGQWETTTEKKIISGDRLGALAQMQTPDTKATPVVFNSQQKSTPEPGKSTAGSSKKVDGQWETTTQYKTVTGDRLGALAHLNTSGVKADPFIVNAIQTGADRVGVDGNKMLTIAAVESDFKPNANAGTSSAKGLFQFVDTTWKSIAPSVGLSASSDPKSIINSSVVGAKYVKDNEIMLANSGIRPNLLESYTAHLLGPTGSKRFIKANPNAIGADVVPSAAKSNRNLFYSGNRALTVAEVKENIKNKLSTKAKKYNIPTDGSVQADKNVTTQRPVATTKPNTVVNKQTNSSSNYVSNESNNPIVVNKPTDIGAKRTTSVPSAINPLVDSASIPIEKANIKTTNTTQDNYSKLLTNGISLSLEYQRTMVDKLSSIDSNISKVIAQAYSSGSSNQNTPKSTPAPRKNNEKLTTTIDLSRKMAVNT